jgi:hypothetical protein
LADGSDPVLTTLRFALFAAVAIAGPGVALQRVLRVRWDPAVVIPLGLVFCAAAYALGLVVGVPWLLPALAVPLDLLLLSPGFRGRRAAGPSLRGAAPPVALLVLLLAATQYRVNRERANGDFLLDLGEHMDTAVHVGLTWELVAGYPPQVPGLAGLEVRYHVGSHLVRAAATRWAGIHPYDSISRFDVTLWGLALVLALRAATHALGLGSRVTALVGYLPLAADLSCVPGLLLGAGFWAFKLGDNFIEALFYANSIAPALTLVLAAVACIARWERDHRLGFLVLAVLLGGGAGFFKVFTGAQLLLALLTGWLLVRRRSHLLVVAAFVAAALALLAASASAPPGAEGVRVSFLPLAPTNPARVAFGLKEAHGLAYVASGLVWIALSLGLRVLGIPGALRSLRGESGAGSVLGALALWGWPLATFLSVAADPAFDESFYFLQASGLALWVFAAPVLVDLARRHRFLAALAVVIVFAPAGEFLVRKIPQKPEVVPAAEVRAMKALRAASCPGDVVLMQTKVAYVPLPVVLAGRRVALADYISYWRQFTSVETLAKRKEEVRAFFQAEDQATALAVARRLDARYVYVQGRRRSTLEAAGVLVPLFEEGGEHVYRIAGVAPASGCRARDIPGAGDAPRQGGALVRPRR